MKHHVSKQRQPFTRTAIYTFMTLTVAIIVSVLMLIVLGYSFNEKDGRLEQGGLLQFASVPNGAAVTLDNLTLGSRTGTKATVDAGNHSVIFNRDNYRSWRKSIQISAGQIGWLNYARMIPVTVTPQSLRVFPTLSGALASPKHKYILMHEASEQPSFALVNIQDDTLRYSSLVLPETVYAQPSVGKTQSFTIESWSYNEESILIRHVYDDDKTEWLLLDRGSPEKSINISKTYGIEPSRVEYAGTGSRQLFVQTDDIVRRINLDEQTLSRPLASNVADFSIYDEKTIIFTTNPDATAQRTVGYAATDIETPVTLAAYPADDQPLQADMATYFNKRYVAIVHGQSLVITAGTLPTDNSNGSMKQFVKQTVPVGVSDVMISRNNRFVTMQLPDGYATYDIELKKYDKTTWATVPSTPRPLSWLDDYMLWSDSGGQLRFYEFDGANQQNIMTVAEGYTATLSPNDKFVYGVSKSDKGFELTRARLVL